jgi:hypothetical protein
MRSPGLLFLSCKIRFCSTVNPSLMGSCIMGIQKIEHYNHYQDSLCRIFMFLVQESLKIKILKVTTHQGGCAHELYASTYKLYTYKYLM